MEFKRWKLFLEILKTGREIDEKPLKNKNLRIMFFVNISEHIQYLRKRILRWIVILIENKIWLKIILVKAFFFKFILFLRGFSTDFRRFLRQFSIFVETGFSVEIPIKRDKFFFNQIDKLSV